MVNQMNSRALILLCVLCIANTASAQTFVCKTQHGVVTYKVPNQSLNLEGTELFQFNENDVNLLKSNCIEIDEQSAVNIHEEGSSVDLNCFGCIIGESKNYDFKESPWNGQRFE